MSVPEALDIDKKVDDGIDTTGRVVAQYIDVSADVTAAPNSPAANTANLL
jgi:hypothetical protein